MMYNIGDKVKVKKKNEVGYVVEVFSDPPGYLIERETDFSIFDCRAEDVEKIA